ncbi:hypothetical protein CHRY9390_01063 [Chryseobacterium aquaeductus]|uniref:Lipoprotein n=1 Tax=Chryseobacterium aquaeductus TaxID=2675056 RepID=A0A9N8MF25_9FLAO|nr:hypothetical protein [Chryseobacterium aquaeductus]CAA7330395.1 hypothetical protein CHRY9390_01063 [Chryseobacterium potabilaquae]CAD7803336.1 hypothetical protein CHRY9390_01063 [Chryseobacterium aquaeductus]
MKKAFLVATSFIALSLTSCKKEGNKGVIKTDTSQQVIVADDGKPDATIGYNVDVKGKKTIKTDYVYKATDGTLVKVVFDYNPENRNMTITNNNKTFVLDKSEVKTNQTTYEKADMKATVKGDSIIIRQGENIIELVKTKI